MTYVKMVREFMETFGQTVRTEKTAHIGERALRVTLIQEEYEEYLEAVKDENLIEIADALGDLIYVTIGAGLAHGYELEPVKEKYVNPVKPRTMTETQLTADIAAYDIDQHQDTSPWFWLYYIQLDVEQLARHWRIPLYEVVEEIHRSNMSKLGENGEVLRRESDGKVLKGPNYFEPNLKKVLKV